jgi:integrase
VPLPFVGKPWIRKSLKTRDLAVAEHRAEVENRWLANLAGANQPQALYNEWLKQALDATVHNDFTEWTPADDIYDEMTQEQLLKILPLLSEEDRIPALVGWHTGMRISAVMSATINTVDNILCFTVEEGKTAAATRWIPMHTAL